MLTDENLIIKKFHVGGGIQRIYRVGRCGLSVLPFSQGSLRYWEITVLVFDNDGLDSSYEPTYDTPLTSDVVRFNKDEDANTFIQEAFKYFKEQKADE